MPLIDRSGASALIPEEFTREIFQELETQSTVMQMARRLPNMSRGQMRLPVASALAQAYFVEGEPTTGDESDGFKQTSNAEWTNKYINAGELAVVIPIPESVLEDSDYDIWAEIRPQIVAAMGQKFDGAVYYGTNAPSNWPDDLLTGVTNAGHIVTLGTGDDLYDDIMAEGGSLAHVEEDGYEITGHVASLSLRAKLRGLRDDHGQPIFNRTVQEGTQYDLDGAPLTFSRNGGVDPTQSLLISGDWSKLVYSIRRDVSMRVFTEGVIQDTEGDILFNLMQQDMVALRATMRIGWQLPNPLNRVNENPATRYPFSVLAPSGS